MKQHCAKDTTEYIIILAVQNLQPTRVVFFIGNAKGRVRWALPIMLFLSGWFKQSSIPLAPLASGLCASNINTSVRLIFNLACMVLAVIPWPFKFMGLTTVDVRVRANITSVKALFNLIKNLLNCVLRILSSGVVYLLRSIPINVIHVNEFQR